MKRFLSIVLAGAMAMGLASCKGNDNTSDWAYIKDKGEMVIGMTIFAPMNYYDDDDKTLIGFETDFAAAVCAKIEIAPKFVEINWGSKEAELDSKSIDCIWNGMTITDELKENTSISTPYMSNRQIIVTKAENAEKYKEKGLIKASNFFKLFSLNF